MRHGEHRKIERRVDQAPCLVRRDVDAELLEEPEDRAGLDRPRGVVIPRDENDRGVGQRLAQPLELTEGEDDRRVGGPNRVEEITGDDNRVGSRRDDPVDGGAEGVRDVGFALVDAGRRLPVVLPDAEVGVGDVGEFHSRNVS